MHITVSASTLIVILVVVIVIAVILRLTNLRHRYQAEKRPRTRQGPLSRKSRFPKSPIVRTRSGRQDHGEEVALRHGHARSPEWSRVAHEHLSHQPGCMVCGHRGQGLQVHHIKPFHLHPELELDPNNLITLCEIRGRDHHLLIGHLDDWESYNPAVRTDVKRYHKESAIKIRNNPDWQKEMLRRPQP